MTKKEQISNLRPFKIFGIEKGTVIDHIPAGKALLLLKLLKLENENKFIALGLNLNSKHQGRKDLLKIENKELTEEEVNQVAVAVPQATINIIRNFKVAKKFKVEMPEKIYSLLKCPNPKCISNSEKIKSVFHPKKEKNNEYSYSCHYCERNFLQKDISLK